MDEVRINKTTVALDKNVFIKSIFVKKYPDRNTYETIRQFVVFWSQKFKTYPTGKDIINCLSDIKL